MTEPYFLDASYLIALIHPEDAFHDKAKALRASLPDDAILVTTDLVIAEVANFFAGRAKRLRDAAGLLAEVTMTAPGYEFVRLRPADFDEALRRYRLPRKRRRNASGLTDIHSMIVMERFDISKVLSGDAAFREEGFNALLLEEPADEEN